MSEPGRLIVCATPIGNLGDVTLRVLDALRDADTIVAEDTRVTRKLLARYDIHAKLERYDEHTAEERTPAIIGRIQEGETVALVSDAGTPGISDPGEILVEACLNAELSVDVLPGPNAVITALVASGLPADAFYFGGFLPRKPGARRRALDELARLDATLVFYESPRRTAATLETMAEAFPGRRAAMARELTKLHEEVVRADVGDLSREIAGRELKGEVVLLVGPPTRDDAESAADPVDLRNRVEALVADGLTRRDAAREVARETGLPRNTVFDAVYGSGNSGAESPDATFP